MAIFVGSLSLLGYGVRRRGIDFNNVTPPISEASLDAFAAARDFYWPAIWLLILADLLMLLTPLGLFVAMPGQEPLALAASVFFLFGILAGVSHVGMQSVAQTYVADRYAAADARAKPHFFRLAAMLYDANDFFEKVWGVARATAMVLFAIALFASDSFPAWVKWASLLGAAEAPFRIWMIAKRQHSGGLQDLFYALWLIVIGIALVAYG
jgi:hypothetical protein